MSQHTESGFDLQAAEQAGAECLAAALAFLSRGWAPSACCPPDHANVGKKHAALCKNPGKVPLGPWKHFQDRPPTENELCQKWRDNNFLNVGVFLGPVSKLVRIDIDGASGEEMLANLCGPLPSTLEFSSGSGGRGLLFGIPEGVILKTTPINCKKKENELHQEVRFQAKGAQTILPPSRHVSGRRYLWLPGHGPDEIDVALLPPALVELMRAKATKQLTCAKPTNRRANVSNGSDVESRARKYLDKCDPAISGQGGHNSTFAVACAIAWGFDLAPEVALDVLQFWNARCQPPWSESELRHKIDDALKVNHDKPRGYLRDAPPPMGVNGHNAPEPGKATHDPIALTDLGNGKRFAADHGEISRYCHPWGKWLLWDGTRWRIDDTGRAMAFAKQTILGLFRWAEKQIKLLADDESPEAKIKVAKIKAVLDFALKSQHVNRLKAVLDLARSESRIPILPDVLDAAPWALNVANGTLDLRTGQLRPHDQADYLTKICPVAFDQSATCQRWKNFLAEIFDCSEALIGYMQRLCGYWLTGQTTEHALPVFWGSGANGKSTLVGAIFDLLGSDHSGKASRDLLTAIKGDKHPTSLAWLHGKRFVGAIETAEGARLDEALVKELTGGDPVTGRRMREDFWTFNPTHKIALVTNHKPTIRGTDHAIWRRLRLIPFTVCFPEEKQDKHLGEKLRTELPGILNWMLAGCLLWQKHGLADPPEVLAATAEYRSAEDRLGEFLAERCQLNTEFRVKTSGLYGAFKEWAKASGEQEMSSKAFGQAIRERGINIDVGRRFYVGIALNASEE